MTVAPDPVRYLPRVFVQLALESFARELEDIARRTDDPDTAEDLLDAAGRIVRAAQ